MNAADLITSIKQHPNFDQAGMVLCHNGVVRATSRDGRRVSGLRVHVDRERLGAVLEAGRQRPGIVDVRVKIAADRDLTVGDDVMVLVVAGDVRENVIAVLEETLKAIKTTVTSKTEFFVDND
ncbi:MAG: molybdenum cofactor biosynthesis protein MoaE [Desulfobacterales bacterium]|nr:molybdenum cofactor biosynthesis protein MoaE [Desulfobacterales bacterium]